MCVTDRFLTCGEVHPKERGPPLRDVSFAFIPALEGESWSWGIVTQSKSMHSFSLQTNAVLGFLILSSYSLDYLIFSWKKVLCNMSSLFKSPIRFLLTARSESCQ